MLPPLFEGLKDAMALPIARFNVEGVKEIEGATSLTVTVMVVESDPAELLAQMV